MSLRLAALTAAAAGILAAQNAPQTPAPADSKPAAAAPKPEAPKPDPVKPFAEIVKNAKVVEGLFPLYRTENKVYLEVAPEQFDKIYMISVTCDSALGERGFYAAEMCGETPFVFHRVNKSVQLIAKNPAFRAAANTPMARAVARSFADSMIGVSPVVSQPHPDRKSVLIDLGPILLKDVVMLSYGLEATFRIPYRFDAANSSFGALKGYDRNVEIETVGHYAAERPNLPPMLAPGAPAPPIPQPPRALQDVRSMLLRFRYSVSELPEAGYKPRLADDRVGFFFDQIEDFSADRDSLHRPTVRYINRWRLEKSDPTAALSEPKKPIVFWLENTIPERYRDAVRDGVLMWNKAFERIGFKNAVVVKQQPDDADWDAGDTRYATIRWFAGVFAGFAQGPSRTNPYTGEIYDADIRFSDDIVRSRKQQIVTESNPLAHLTSEEPFVFTAPWSTNKQQLCNYMAEAVKESQFAFDVLATRDIDPDSPEAEAIVKAFVREIAAHEVGHTLGLRHNFRASTIRTLAGNQDASVTSQEGLTGSVMDYIPTNLAARGAKQGEYHQSTLGPYDYWAIEYAYKPIQSATPEAELPELRKIASCVAEANLAYATDEDAGFGATPINIDPLANRFDLGTDPLEWYTHRVRLSQEVFRNMEAKLEKPGEGYQVLRRSFGRALGQAGQAMFLSANYIGGVYYHRDHAGDPNGRLPYQNVPAVKQKQALQLINENCFAPGAFRFTPTLLAKLSGERFFDRFGPGPMQNMPDVPLHDAILSMQKAVLDRVMHPVILKRLVDSELRASNDADRFRMSELFASVQQAIWAETQAPGKAVYVNSHRRSLQREHLRKLIGMLLRDASAPEDARTLSRHFLAQLRTQLQTAAASPAAMGVETRAHLTESIARIDEAMKANMQRMAF